jgi:hypothetical protein
VGHAFFFFFRTLIFLSYVLGVYFQILAVSPICSKDIDRSHSVTRLDLINSVLSVGVHFISRITLQDLTMGIVIQCFIFGVFCKQ